MSPAGNAVRKLAAAILISCLGFLVFSAPALACRISFSRFQFVHMHYDAVVLATIPQVAVVPKTPYWKATAVVKRRIEGKVKTARFQLSGPHLSCSEEPRKPVTGEDWMLYLRRDAGDRLVIAVAFPLSDVQDIDPRLNSPAKAAQ